ncbi:MAG: MBL fold metallo-hydrolase [Clostridiales bacterium]|nr:MBL fold metallo-hydrolase [Clostridiales bacterium]
MQELKFLGYGAAFYPVLGNTNAFFEAEGDLFFLDFGEAAYEKVVRCFDLKKYRHIYVILTHLHADHSGSLASLLSYTHCVLGVEVNVVHPLETVVELLKLQGISPKFYRYMPTLPDSCPVAITPYDVPHATDMRAFGYVLSAGGEAVYYSGDAADVPEPVLSAFLAGKIARLYQDTARNPSSSHCLYTHLEEIIPMESRPRVFCMHLDGDYEQMLKEHGFSVVQPAFKE